jgi:hypothetical protein
VIPGSEYYQVPFSELVLLSSFAGILMYTYSWKFGLGGRTLSAKLGSFGLAATETKNVIYALRKYLDYKERERFEVIMIW